jgi:hypothetical protein
LVRFVERQVRLDEQAFPELDVREVQAAEAGVGQIARRERQRGHALGLVEARAEQLAVLEPRREEVGAGEARVGEVAVAEGRRVQARIGEADVLERALDEQALREVGLGEVETVEDDVRVGAALLRADTSDWLAVRRFATRRVSG